MKKQKKPRPGKKKGQTRPRIEQEKAALAWATEYFHRDKTGLEKGIPDEIREGTVDVGVMGHDAMGESSPFAAETMFAPYQADWFIKGVSAKLLERGDQLAGGLSAYSAAALRDPSSVTSPKTGRKPMDSFNRYITIGIAVDYVAKKWGFSRTRSRHNTKNSCAASIVREAMAAGANFHLSEAEIIRASDEYRQLMGLVRPFFSRVAGRRAQI